MEPFSNVGGNIFGLIPPQDMRKYIEQTEDPVHDGKRFGHILWERSNCKYKGGSGDKYFMAIDYLEVMLSGYKFDPSIATDPKWGPFFRGALEEFGDRR